MQSIEEVYRQHAQTVFRYLLSLTGDEDLSEELTQETFYQAIRSSGRFDGNCKVTTWLCAIAKNVLLSHRRKHPAAEDLEAADLTVPSAEQEASLSLSRVELMKSLHGMPEPYREVLYLRLFGDLSFREIGDVFGKSENWARVTFYRGKEKIRKEVTSDEQ